MLSLVACGGDECSQPRTGDEEACDTYDGGQLSFVLGDPAPELSAYCESRCVDVNAPITIGGYDDLRKVPFLPKVRQVRTLGIIMDGLRDLRGLEKVDVTGNLLLSSNHGDTSRKTLEGLSDEEVSGFSIDRVPGLSSFEGHVLKRAVSLSLVGSEVERLDLRAMQVSSISLTGNDELQALALSSEEMEQVYIWANAGLSEFSWQPGLTVRRSVTIGMNPSLSSCSVQRFVEETDGGAHRFETIRNNGPCP